MGYLAAWYRERPRVVEAVQMVGPAQVPDVCEFIGARAWIPSDVDVEFLNTASGSMIIPWGDWVVRLHDVRFEIVPAPIFVILYEVGFG